MNEHRTPEDCDIAEDFGIIRNMIAAAEQSGLLVEVVWSYGNEIHGGADVPTAASAALYEWDI